MSGGLVAHVALILTRILLQDHAALPPAIAGALLHFMKQASVEAELAFRLSLRVGFAGKSAACGQQVRRQPCHAHHALVVIALRRIQRREELFQRAVHLHLSLVQELGQQRGGFLAAVQRVTRLVAQLIQNLAGELHRPGEFSLPCRLRANQGRKMRLQRQKAAFLQLSVPVQHLPAACPEGFFGRNGKNREFPAETGPTQLGHVIFDHRDLLRAAQIRLLQHENHVPHPVPVYFF